MIKKKLTHFHFCCGLGGGAKGFNRAKPIVGSMQAHWECLGGIDVDAAGLRDFQQLAGVPGTLMDLFTRDQYIRFHGKEPPSGWQEATPEDVRKTAQGKRPDAVFISSPCKGASGLLSEQLAQTPKYQALNELTLRCIWLMGEAWADDPVSLIVFENVPRLATRGRHLLDQINSLLGHYGYAVAETTHDCGELGGLAQSRKRFLLVARHVEKVPPFLYEPEKKTLRAVGDILGRMPLPGDIETGGPMHRIPSLQWKTWVRLALVRAGSDWRSLNELAIEDGYLRDLVIVPEYHHGYLGVHGWGDTSGTIAGASGPTNGAFSVADPRIPAAGDRLTCIIRSLDGTWHRPFTTLEKAALQSLVEPEEQLILDGLSDKDWSERIGNAVPPAAAEAIAHVMGTTLLLAAQGETFMLSMLPIWVRQVGVGLSVSQVSNS
ncbi:DNA cytosine methyltransferase [Pseudomonas sp. I2]|uniref:DNA cytosine methyltransferase n=1 Tax=Pseudomonas sp. I2 TaxID=1338438 RepID=UPI0034D681C2